MTTNKKLEKMIPRLHEANEWSSSHNATFKFDKFALVPFSRKPASRARGGAMRTMLIPSLTLGDIDIKPSVPANLLGVHLDQEPRWKTHINAEQAKGMSYIMAAKRLSQGKRGVPGRVAVLLYSGVVVPKMLYAAEGWCQPIEKPLPGKKRKRGSVDFAKKMAPVQRMAAIFVTGAVKSTPT